MERSTAPCRLFGGILGLAGCLLLLGCASISKGESALDLGIKDRGVASWYGKEFHGRLAANGEIFDMTALTAAHRKLPLGSLVRVVNLINGRHVYVRINDRGPYVVGRVLDVSFAAAVELGMVESGVSVVHLEVIGQHRPLMPLLMKTNSPQNAFRFSLEQSGKDTGANAIPGVSLDVRTPDPIERLFPREILHERRERRNAGLLADGFAAPMPFPHAAGG